MLDDRQLDRFARHIVLPEIGGAGQARLLDAHVLVVGAGGIGCPALAYLAAAGVGRITIMDDDVVELSNLQRQILFGEADLGRPKAEVAARALAALNPQGRYTPLVRRFDSHYALGEGGAVDVICDGSDSFGTRLAANRWSLAHRVPLVSAAIGRFELQVATYRGWEADMPCYQCLVGDAPAEGQGNCGDEGVLGAVAGIAGSMAALEVVRAITGFGERVAGRLSILDTLAMRFRALTLAKDPGCAACGGGRP